LLPSGQVKGRGSAQRAAWACREEGGHMLLGPQALRQHPGHQVAPASHLSSEGLCVLWCSVMPRATRARHGWYTAHRYGRQAVHPALRQVRETEFPMVREYTYLNTASQGPWPTRTIQNVYR